MDYKKKKNVYKKVKLKIYGFISIREGLPELLASMKDLL